MKILFLMALLLLARTKVVADMPPPNPSTDGYPIANFALTVNASVDGDLYGQILQNPGRLGEWLANRGSLRLGVEKDGKRHAFSGFRQKEINRLFPFVKNTYGASPCIACDIQITTFCPLGLNDAGISSLPLLMLEVRCTNPTEAPDRFRLTARPDEALAKGMQVHRKEAYSGLSDRSACQVTVDAPTRWENGELSFEVALAPGEQKCFHVLTAFYDPEWTSANRFADIDELTAYGHKTWPFLKEKTERFAEAIPATGDTELDMYLRWYVIPAVSLTKQTKDNQVVTMGYCELNQRDSYWTSWLHLVFYPGLERQMIEESIAYQQPSGKIPTTILPLIERSDDLDINAFFILRATRFYQYYHDREVLAAWWPSLREAMDWLMTRDDADSGLPAQVSFWGDWKDVRGVEGRKYSPFSCLLYLAALKQMISLSEVCNDREALAIYESAYRKGYATINRSVGEGGLWNGEYYCQIWRDGTVNDKLLQDQTIGILFDVIPADRARKIFESLNTRSMTPYGICETSPYYPADFGYAPATYHNGGVWPWVSFMDCWARIRSGRTLEAVELIKKVARADLTDSGDWSPNEHINSLTGENLGFRLQGWNAALFGLVYFGLVHPDVLPE